MALPRKLQRADGRWYIDPGTGDGPIECASSAVATSLLAAMLAGGSWEVTFKVIFGAGLPYLSEATRVKKS